MQPLRQTAQYVRFLWALARDPRFQAIAGAAIGLIAIGSVVFWFLEGWPPLDAVYFSVMTLTTIGYGDVVPATAPGKIFTMVCVVLGVGLLGSFLSLIAKRATERLEERWAPARDDGGERG